MRTKTYGMGLGGIQSAFYRFRRSAGSVGLTSAPKYGKSGGMKHVLGLALMATLALAMLFGASIPPAHAALGLDGQAALKGACTPSCATTLTTSSPNDVIYLIFTTGSVPTTNPPAITDAAGLTWGLRTTINNGAGYLMYSWYAISSGVLTADTITVSATVTLSTNTILAFGISGANTGAPFDPHSGIPATQAVAQTTPPGYSLSITTSNANDFIISAISGPDAGPYVPTAPNTQINTFAAPVPSVDAYHIVSSTGTYSGTFTASAGGAASELIVDAVQMAGGPSVPEFPTGLLVLAVPVLAIYLFMRGKGVSLGTRTRIADAWAQTMLQLAGSR